MKNYQIEEKKARMMENFTSVHENMLAIIEDYIVQGYVQTLANLLIFLGDEHANSVLGKLPEPVQKMVRNQYENLPSKNRDESCVLCEVRHILKKSGLDGRRLCEFVTKGLDFNTLHLLSAETEELAKTDPIIAESIEKYLFKFEDFMNLEDTAIQKILRETEQQTVALALKNAETALQEKIFSNMSKNACQLLKEDMEFMGTVRISDIEEARMKMVKTVRRLEASGEIVVFEKAKDVLAK